MNFFHNLGARLQQDLDCLFRPICLFTIIVGSYTEQIHKAKQIWSIFVKGLLHCLSTCTEFTGNNWYCLNLKNVVNCKEKFQRVKKL